MDEIENYLQQKPFNDPTKFYSYRWNDTHRDGRYGHFDEDGDLEKVKFEVEIKTMKGQNEESNVERVTFSGTDFDWSVPYQPTLDITKHIQVMGDYYSDNSKEMRTITTFRMYLDYESFVVGVYNNVIDYFNDFKNRAQQFKVTEEVCPEFDTYTPDTATFSDADREQMALDWEAEKEAKIIDFSKEFTVFDEEYQRQVAEFEE